MNYIEKQKEYKRILSMFKYTSISGSREGCFRSYTSESLKHINLKFALWLKLKKKGYKIWSELILKSGIRMDILCWDGEKFYNYEVLCSEGIEDFLSKCKKYPNIEIIPIKTMKEIEDLII